MRKGKTSVSGENGVSTISRLEDKLKDKSAIIGILGLGYVGLPLAVAFAESDLKVIGFDVNANRVEEVNQGESYIADISDETLSKLVISKRLFATTDLSQISKVDAICICVPTPLNQAKEPNLSYVICTSQEVSRYLRRDQLVILESTTYPGTTREIILPILKLSGLKASQDFYLAYSPERIDPGNRKFNIKNTPKILGGIDQKSTRLAKLLYEQVADEVIAVSSPDVAEMTKVFENVFRSVNIALVNELAILCENMKISVWEVIDTASSKPFGYLPFYPGPGIGGHCIPLDPYYLASKAREYDYHMKFIELAAEINEQMPHYVTSRIIESLNAHGKSIKGAELLVLGVTYKPDVGDVRGSPSLKLIKRLQEKGAKVNFNDPYIAEIEVAGHTLTSMELTTERLSAADCVVITTNHSSYDYQSIVDTAKLIYDARGVTRTIKRDNIIRLGE